MTRTALFALALIATPAHADGFTNREIAYQVLNAVDTAETIDCLNQDVCHEANPLLGRNPSPGKLIAVKAGTGVAHYAVARFLRYRDPEAARLFQFLTIAIQGGVVAANLRFAL